MARGEMSWPDWNAFSAVELFGGEENLVGYFC